MSYHLERRQVVGGRLDEVFAFFKDPKNLEALTPSFLGFRVVASTQPEVRLDTRISYRLSLHGIPIRWQSRIAEYIEGERFADEMLKGPYRRWYHRHLFRAVPGGVEITDLVEYELPLGVLGQLVHALFVQRELRMIFDYRAEQVSRRFPPLAPSPDEHEMMT